MLLFYFSVPSSAPTGVRVTRFDYTYDLLVEWDPLPRHLANGKILGYAIYYIEYNHFWSPHKRVNSSGHYPIQYTLKGLKPAHEYFVAVAAFTSKGVGPKSNYANATTGKFQKSLFLLITWMTEVRFLFSLFAKCLT